MFKSRSGQRPPKAARVRDSSQEREIPLDPAEEGEDRSALSLDDLAVLRKLRKGKQGINAAKLNKGDAKKRKRARADNEVPEDVGLRLTSTHQEDDEESDGEGAKARKAVRSNNFTQQTNTLDVDKHMMAFIEDNMKARRKGRGEEEPEPAPGRTNPQEDLYRLTSTSQLASSKAEDGNVTSSLAMLTAIPEVDLGMGARLKNIEDTEKAKRAVAEDQRLKASQPNQSEEEPVPSRFQTRQAKDVSERDVYQSTVAEVDRNPPEQDPRQPLPRKEQSATDEAVLERFKKRMRK